LARQRAKADRLLFTRSFLKDGTAAGYKARLPSNSGRWHPPLIYGIRTVSGATLLRCSITLLCSPVYYCLKPNITRSTTLKCRNGCMCRRRTPQVTESWLRLKVSNGSIASLPDVPKGWSISTSNDASYDRSARSYTVAHRSVFVNHAGGAHVSDAVLADHVEDQASQSPHRQGQRSAIGRHSPGADI